MEPRQKTWLWNPDLPRVQGKGKIDLTTNTFQRKLLSPDQTGSVKQYAGDWFEGKREGFGLMLYHHQESYEGEWLSDRREGWGRMTYRDGSYYEANFVISPNSHPLLLSNSGHLMGVTGHDYCLISPGLDNEMMLVS